MKYLITLCLLMPMSLLQASDFIQEGDTIIYASSEDHDITMENVQMAIADKGLRVSGTLHISDMLNRTAKDLEIKNNVFIKAESIEFCSALWSHKMVQLDPLNLNVCPFTIAVYIKTDEPEQVYVAFRQPYISSKQDSPLRAEIIQALHDIVSDSI